MLKNFPSFIQIVVLLVKWGGLPPTADDLEKILVTPLGGALSREFREEGVAGIREAFDNLIDIQDEEQIKKEKQAQKDSRKRLSRAEIEKEDAEAINDAATLYSNGPLPSHLPDEFFKELKEFHELFAIEKVKDSVENIAATFQDDEMFAYLRLAGPNPVWIERVTEDDPIFKKFPVTDEHYQAVMGAADSLSRGISEGRVYAVDYSLVDGALEGAFGPKPEQQKYLYPAMALFAVPDRSQSERFLQPIAIQCGQDPAVNPIITPASGYYPWLAAKTAVQIADANIHEAIVHLARTHLFVEPFVVATHRQLPESHPIYRLLRPHFEGTILINYGAWKILTAPGQGVNQLLAPTICQSRTLAIQGLYMRGFNEEMLPKRLQSRRVTDREALPIYPYRDDALAIWDALHEWVDSYVRAYFSSDGEIASDVPLQNWAAELVSFDGGRVKDFGSDGNGTIETIDYLVDALTLIIFTGSAQHAAVNFPQKGIMSYAPAQPMAGYLPAEEIPTIDSEEKFCQLLPPKTSANQQLLLLQILGGVNYTHLGGYEKGQFDSSLEDDLKRFRTRLNEIDDQIDLRNKELPGKFEYTYLKSENIPQSINI